MKRTALAITLGLALAGLGTAAFATRNAAGTYSLPAGNPVVSGTSISSTWANNTLGDLGNELTDSLSRSGKGPMLAPVRTPDGTVAAPTHTFTNETGSGLYRAGASDVRMSISGTDRAKLTAGGLFVDVRTALTAVSATVKGAVADGATAVGVVLDNTIALANASAKLVSFRSNGVEKASIDAAGKGSFVGLDAGSQKITAVADPTLAQDAATKTYVDTATAVATDTPTAGTGWTLTSVDVKRQGKVVTIRAYATVNNVAASFGDIFTVGASFRPPGSDSGSNPLVIGSFSDAGTGIFLARFGVNVASIANPGRVFFDQYQAAGAGLTNPPAPAVNDFVFFSMTYFVP